MNIKDNGYGRLWKEEEFILSLDLYFNTLPEERDKRNSRIIELAEMINRTPASIVYRLGNYLAVDPKAESKGFGNGGKMVSETFNKYAAHREVLACLSQQIIKDMKNKG